MLPTSLSQSMAAFFNQARANLGPLSDARLEREWLSKVRVVSTSQPLLPPKEFNLQKYDDEGRFGFGNGKKIHLSFRIDKAAGRHLLEAQLSLDQTVKEKPNHYDIAATVVETEQLEWWLRGFGDRVSNIRRTRIPTASTND